MCSMADVYELRDRQQKRKLEKRTPENLLKEERIDTTESVCRDEEYVLETSSAVKETETIPVKITILHTKNESIIVKTEEDPRKPWYFTHV